MMDCIRHMNCSKHRKYVQWNFFIDRLKIREKYEKIFKQDDSVIEW